MGTLYVNPPIKSITGIFKRRLEIPSGFSLNGYTLISRKPMLIYFGRERATTLRVILSNPIASPKATHKVYFLDISTMKLQIEGDIVQDMKKIDKAVRRKDFYHLPYSDPKVSEVTYIEALKIIKNALYSLIHPDPEFRKILNKDWNKPAKKDIDFGKRLLEFLDSFLKRI